MDELQLVQIAWRCTNRADQSKAIRRFALPSVAQQAQNARAKSRAIH